MIVNFGTRRQFGAYGDKTPLSNLGVTLGPTVLEEWKVFCNGRRYHHFSEVMGVKVTDRHFERFENDFVLPMSSDEYHRESGYKYNKSLGIDDLFDFFMKPPILTELSPAFTKNGFAPEEGVIRTITSASGENVYRVNLLEVDFPARLRATILGREPYSYLGRALLGSSLDFLYELEEFYIPKQTRTKALKKLSKNLDTLGLYDFVLFAANHYYMSDCYRRDALLTTQVNAAYALFLRGILGDNTYSILRPVDVALFNSDAKLRSLTAFCYLAGNGNDVTLRSAMDAVSSGTDIELFKAVFA